MPIDLKPMKVTDFATGCKYFFEHLEGKNERDWDWHCWRRLYGQGPCRCHAAVAALFNTELRPRLEMICATTDESAQKYRKAYGLNRAKDWQTLVHDEKVEAMVIASPQETHADIARLPLRSANPFSVKNPSAKTWKMAQKWLLPRKKVAWSI